MRCSRATKRRKQATDAFALTRANGHGSQAGAGHDRSRTCAVLFFAAPERRFDRRPGLLYILQYMKQILVEVDDQIAEELERVAPARSRQRSEFIRRALRRALWEQEERRTREAYAEQPDDAGDVHVEPSAWEAPARKQAKR